MFLARRVCSRWCNIYDPERLKKIKKEKLQKKCLICGNIFTQKKTESPLVFIERRACSRGCSIKDPIRLSRVFDVIPRGNKSHFWIDGRTSENTRLRNSSRAKRWRVAVFERDRYTCVFCKKRGGVLNADHIKPWSTHPKLRFKITNGRTLCIDCHKKTPTFARNSKYLCT